MRTTFQFVEEVDEHGASGMLAHIGAVHIRTGFFRHRREFTDEDDRCWSISRGQAAQQPVPPRIQGVADGHGQHIAAHGLFTCRGQIGPRGHEAGEHQSCRCIAAALLPQAQGEGLRVPVVQAKEKRVGERVALGTRGTVPGDEVFLLVLGHIGHHITTEA